MQGKKQLFVVALIMAVGVVASLAGAQVPQWKVWEQADDNGRIVPHYSISLDGRTFSEPRPTTYEITLRHGAFEPQDGRDAPAVEPGLAADLDTNLFIVQFHTQPLEYYRQQLRAFGVEVYTYLAHHSHIVRMDPALEMIVEALPFVRWVGPYHPAYKIDPLVLDALERGDGTNLMQDFSVQVFQRGLAQQQAVARRIAALGGKVMNVAPDSFRMTVTMTPGQLTDIARMDEVQYIDPWGPGELDMDIARQIGGAVPTLSNAGYTGQGVRGEIFDTEVSADHPEWNGQTPLYHGLNGNAGTHGSSCYGINFSTGVVQAQATGLLPDREQGIFNYYNNATQFGGPTTRLQQNTEATDPAGPYRSVFQTSSVGSPRTTQYTTISAETDDYLFQVDYLSCQSMSNASLTPDTRPQAWAKNIVGVGGIRHLNTLTRSDDSSAGSTGPAADGRIKPDLAHFYDYIYTTTSGSSYTNFGGTSGATPITAGHFGLLFQMWHEGVFPGHGGGASVFDSRPKSTTAKAMLINTAYRYDWNSGGSNSNMWRVRQGWGMADVGELYNSREKIFIIDESDVLTNLGSSSYILTAAAGEPVFRATMVYIDPAGNPGSSVHRINDLSLKVTSPSGTVYWGNNGLMDDNFSTPGGSANTVDTVENVFIENPQAGNWTVQVIASEINEDSHLETPAIDADYALVVTGVTTGVDPTGACCVDIVCSIETEADCIALGGEYLGDGTNCDGNPCVDPLGACCIDTVCSIETEADCVALGGEYLGDGTDCDGDPCADPLGACCVDTVCSIETEADCIALGGLYLGDGTNCDGDPCSGEIINLAETDFATANGLILAGSFVDTWAQDDVYEALQEERTGGKPSKRKSLLDHVWTFTVEAGAAYSFFIDAHHTANGEGDDFIFSYSLDDSVYTDMVTVTKTADDDVLQSYAFGEDIAGAVYVRVEDADGTQGNSVVDTVFVDEMFIVTTSTGGDITPPSAPTGLLATGGNGFVSLDWLDNAEPDLDGYNVYRAEASGGPYEQMNGSLLVNSDFVDDGVTNGTTYYYVVTAVDTTGNESAGSDEVLATPQEPGGGPTATHVGSILATAVNTGAAYKRGRADIAILDNFGDPVAGADVTATFTGDYAETITATTGADGVATLLTEATVRGGVVFTVCVDDVTHASLVYNAAANVVTCGSN